MLNTNPLTKQEQISINNHFNIVDIILLDHSYLKECINIINDKKQGQTIKLKYAKCFLDTLKKHHAAEKKAIYTPLSEVSVFRPYILEGEIEHAMIDAKIKSLSGRIKRSQELNDKINAELKVLSLIVKIHLESEESEIIPKMRKYITKQILNQMGYQFMVIRKFSAKDLDGRPELKLEMPKVVTPIIPQRMFTTMAHDYFNKKLH